jgi:phosphoglycolate phosphatase-like HAD superfamily hydrolase
MVRRPAAARNVARLLPGADAALIERAVNLYRERYDQTGYLESEVYDGVHEMLSVLGRDHQMIVATAKFGDVAERVLEAFQLRPHFAAVFGSHHDGTFADKRDLVAHVATTASMRSVSATATARSRNLQQPAPILSAAAQARLSMR